VLDTITIELSIDYVLLLIYNRYCLIMKLKGDNMIEKSKFAQYRRENPVICGTCYFFEPTDNDDGRCYGLPPAEEKTVRVKSKRRACSIHQTNQRDIIQSAFMLEPRYAS
jgi:hypothetical protein